MQTGGEIYIVGYVLNDDRRSPPETAAYNLVFLNIYDEGEAYTESEYKIWLEAAGFKNFQRIVQTRGYSYLFRIGRDALREDSRAESGRDRVVPDRRQ